MKLDIKHQPKGTFPSLAWVARKKLDKTDVVSVWCGELVEAGSDYIVEGVWPGAFGDAGFDQSELFYGSGARVRGNSIFFASSCSTVDRMWCHKDEGSVTVSNSLPCLLRIARIDLVSKDDRYAHLVQTIVKGRVYRRGFPVTSGELNVHYFENLALDGSRLKIMPKTQHIDPFSDFESYSRFLFDTSGKMGSNARDAARVNPVTILGTVSKGYDSPVASLMARIAGGRKAFTIRSARSIIPREDSGSKICEFLGLECEEYTNSRSNIEDELWYWAANGSLQDMNFSIFDYPPGPSVMFTGFNGDMVWARSRSVPEDYLKRKDSTGLGFCEHRLIKGVIHCPVPFWGIRHLKELKRISEDPEMTPWSIGGDYDRPIPRRIVEEEGVPRECFGQKKSATTVDELLLLPIRHQMISEYKKFLELQNTNAPRVLTLPITRAIFDLWRATFRQRIMDLAENFTKTPVRAKTFSCENYLFPWANQSLKSDFRIEQERAELD